jgi:small conductance mechanosensitive channel
MRSKAIKAIKKTFDEQDITIPFPIRTLDFGIKAGKNSPKWN